MLKKRYLTIFLFPVFLFSFNQKISGQVSDSVFDKVEQLPEYPKGEETLSDFIAKNLIYPYQAFVEGIQGVVAVQFVVEKDGSISNIEISRSVHPELDKEALRVVGLMPKWTPGKQKNENVRVRMNLPFNFGIKPPPDEEK